MISTNEFRSGLYIKINGQLYNIISSQHHKPGKGGAVVRTKLKNLKTGSTIDKTFRSGECVEDAFIEEKKYQYLYKDDGIYHFMDSSTFEQIAVSQEIIGDNKKFLKENTELSVLSCEGSIISIKLPIFIDLLVVDTEPGTRGDTVKAGTKNAKLETGYSIQVPLFINKGTRVRIDTRTGKYIGRS